MANASSSPSELAKLVLQNAGQASLAGGVTTLGQVFVQGELPANSGLVARIGGVSVPVQMDVKTTWPDGSVKMAVLSMERPTLAAGTQVDVVLSRAAAPASGPAVDLDAVLHGHSFVVDLNISGKGREHVDVLAALKDAVADGTASFWQNGSLSVQARVEVPIAGTSQRLVFDVTAFKGGEFKVDAQFNNDRAMEAVGGKAVYDISVTMDGQKVLQQAVTQAQYQNWHQEFSSGDHDGGQGLGSADSGWLNIRQDIARLEAANAVADYDLTLKIPESTLQRYEKQMAGAGWNDPFAVNDVAQYMPTTGGRPDIGIVSAANTVWLISQDPRAAAYALSQAETASTIPWNFWDAAHDTWVSTDNYPKISTSGRTGMGKPGDAMSAGLTQNVDANWTGWVPDVAHQPELSYVPYILTGERWMLDNLGAQAAWNIASGWNVPRQDDKDILVDRPQVRSASWGLRELENAAWAAPDGSAEKAYFTAAADANWKFLVDQIPTLTARQGEAYGWIDPGNYDNYGGGVAIWQQDYFASTVIFAAGRGSADALTVLNWMSNFLIGRFEHDADGFDIRDGAAYTLAVVDRTTGKHYQTWAEIGRAMDERDQSNNEGWSKGGPGGALATLAGIYQLTGSERALAAYKAVVALNAPDYNAAELARLPNFAVALPGLYPAGKAPTPAPVPVPSTPVPPVPVPVPPVLTPPTQPPATPQKPDSPNPGAGGAAPGSAGNDNKVLDKPVQGISVDLGAGDDRLVLASGGVNSVEVSNVETIIGGSGSDTVTLATLANGATVDLGAGNDRLLLANGSNVLRVSNVETITGGSGSDAVTLAALANGATIDLGAGDDRLVLAAGGANNLKVSNIETIIGDSGNDTVTLATLASDVAVDLGAGNDKLVLASGGANSAKVSNVETIIGGSGNDTVTLATLANDVTIDLGAGNDKLVLASGGANSVKVSNVETIIGGSGNDTVTLATLANDVTIDLGAGDDRLLLANGSNTLTVWNVESVQSAGGADVLTLGSAIQNGFVDLSAGSDKLILSSAGANSLTVSNVETIIGGSRDDAVTLGASVWGVTVDLGGGSDSLVLADTRNMLTVTNTETILGGSGADRITVTGSAASFISGGGGADILVGGSGDDTLLGGAEKDLLTGGAGADHFRYTAISDSAAAAPSLWDSIQDFQHGVDQLEFSGLLTGQFSYRGSAAFTGSHNSEARFVDARSDRLQIDVNGDGAADMTMVVDGLSASRMTASDFLWS
ncbi:M10 family metallopeptidase C-terminal domain-containing protein [Roseomonas sp. BN140053]|uniref:M10 family metallopeptidase C-terminal domain-containing protein n=1 Tax=Roseomonas sp. BN140053 TaxID=3391898 RepID=UPI0039E92F08